MGFFSGVGGIGRFLDLLSRLILKFWSKHETSEAQDRYDSVEHDPAGEWMRRFKRTKNKGSNTKS